MWTIANSWNIYIPSVPDTENLKMATDPNEFQELVHRLSELSQEQREEIIERLEHSQATAVNGQSNRRSALDGFKERGLLGSITDAPEDWSTNPKYMEGFGQDGK